MKLDKIIQGIKDGTITILENEHHCNSLLEKLKRSYESSLKHQTEYREKIKNGEHGKDDVEKCKRMVEYYGYKFETEFGHYIDGEQYCFNCGLNMYIILIDENTIGYIPSCEYWEIAEASGKKYDFIAKKEDCKPCECSSLVKAQKMVATINVPSGKLIFQNHFQKKELYESKTRESINSILGRNELMQELATRDVGYGQMGNMSVGIYSNEKDEIIIGDAYAEDSYEDDKCYYDENPNEIDDEWLKKEKEYKEFKKVITDGNFVNKGEISLGVWRWMCADIEVLKKHGEKPNTDDSIKIDVKKGTYEIEHYYDFPKNGDYIYSRIKLK